MLLQSYDCSLEGLAMTIVSDCPSKPTLTFVPATKSVNYAVKRAVNAEPADDNEYATILGEAVEEWLDYQYEAVLDKNVTYEDEAMVPYANIIYNNTISVGCSTLYCANKKRTATACIYSAKPKLGEPLYTHAKTGTKCDPAKKHCAKAIKGAKCQDSSDQNTEGLCFTDLKEVPPVKP
ncbi:hypothetical protein ANCCAN_05485 [Ancylostoma caninum]|uniref:SCP domain-containing protein n=1 Tax=Ancylostoma caninum TaxID=29170 RepID=A0A368GYP7_ANCCA|nr:hypothetical protein ANCCAN_05485 [Ancylostoma caninum]